MEKQNDFREVHDELDIIDTLPVEQRAYVKDFLKDMTAHEKAQFKKDLWTRMYDKADKRDLIETEHRKQRWTAVITNGVTTIGSVVLIIFGARFAKPLLKVLK